MNCIRFGWLAGSRQTAICSLIAVEVAEWSCDWWISHATGDVGVHALDRNPADNHHALPYVAAGSTGSLAMHLGGKDLDAVGRHLAGALDSADAGWAQCIGEQALEALTARVFRRAGIAVPPRLSESVVSPSLEHSCFGAMHVHIALGRLNWVLTIDRQLADRLVLPRVTQGAALTARLEAMDQASVAVCAMLDFGSVNLTDLSDLEVGEILVSERSLQDTLQMYVEGYGAVAGAYLKRSGARRAVMLDGHSLDGEKS